MFLYIFFTFNVCLLHFKVVCLKVFKEGGAVHLFIQSEKSTVSFKKGEVLIVTQETFGKFKTIHPEPNLKKCHESEDMSFLLTPFPYLGSPDVVPPALSWQSAHAPKLVAKVYVEVFLNHMVYSPHHLLSHGVAHHGEFAITNEGGKSGGRACLCRGLTTMSLHTKRLLDSCHG